MAQRTSTKQLHSGWWVLVGLLVLTALIPFQTAAQESARGDGGGDSFVVLLADGNHILSGSQPDLDQARRQLSGVGVWFERDGRAYVIRDAATVQQIESLFQAQKDLARQQGELGKRRAEIGAEQAEIAARGAELSAQEAEQWSRGAQADATGVESQRKELDEEMKQLDEPRAELDRQQDELSLQQRKLARQSEIQAREILGRAVASGLAQQVR